ncbi:MAG TPA: hypothetical protein VN604_07505 [Nitrospirota bacterium]|nr:hypothetical protein [Nitrospirota bacterium]
MRIRIVCSAVLAGIFLSTSAFAADVSGQSRTYILSREAIDKSDLMPFFEFLDFRAEDVGVKNVSFHFGGWLRYDLRDDSVQGKDKNSDLSYAYLRIRGDRADSALDLGRVLVNEGVASEQVDGAYARTALLGGFTVAAFGGAPVETYFDDRGGDSVYGGRISHGAWGIYRVGLSYLKEKNGNKLDNGKEVSKDFREEEGVDLWFKPFDKMELLGNAFYNAITENWMFQTAYVTFGPFAGARLTGNATKVLYKDYFTSSTTTAFKFDPAIINPAIEMTSAGGEASYTIAGVTLSGDYKKYTYRSTDPAIPEPGDADYFGGRLAYSASGKGGVGVGYHRMDGETSPLQYDEYRVYAFKRFGAFDITADYFNVRYDVEINGVKNAYAAVLAGGWNIADTLRLAADVEYGHNPFYDKEVRGIVKLVYNFDIAPPAKAPVKTPEKTPAPKGRKTK